jgi:transglutaminase-like putative cysteine protease
MPTRTICSASSPDVDARLAPQPIDPAPGDAILSIATHLVFDLGQPSDVLLQIEAASLPEQTIVEAKTAITGNPPCSRIAAQDAIGERMWLRAEGRVDIAYSAQVVPLREAHDLTRLELCQPRALAGEIVPYLFDSRYCPAGAFHWFVESEFPGTTGGARVAAIHDWIASRFTYAPGTSTPDTGAIDTFHAKQGICRDYAHVLIALARASTIPARYVACYAPGVTPPDFHAVAEVYLRDPDSGARGWHMVDATGMASAPDTAIIGVGRDAADVGFLTAFGPCWLVKSEVEVTCADPAAG